MLTEGLVSRGIEVTLYATQDSVTSAVLDGICPHGYAEDPDTDGRVWEALHVSYALAGSAEFGLVHNQMDWLPLAFDRQVSAPMVTTIHGFSGRASCRPIPGHARAMSRYPTMTGHRSWTMSRRSITA
jgi:hypothetical protein